MEMHNLSLLLSSAFTVSRMREMLMRQEQFVILSTAPKPPKILVNYIHKNYRPQPCLPCDYFKLNKSSLWSRNNFFEVFTTFLTTDFIYNSTDLKLIIPQPGSLLETPLLPLGWVFIWFNHSNCTALIVLRTPQEYKEYCRGFHL